MNHYRVKLQFCSWLRLHDKNVPKLFYCLNVKTSWCFTYRQMFFKPFPGFVGSDCHLRLTDYASSNLQYCPYISPVHASIFYDEWSGHFELLNYSEFGCRVDSIPFVNETTEKPVCKIMVSCSLQFWHMTYLIYISNYLFLFLAFKLGASRAEIGGWCILGWHS